ncbi:MAG: GNAT family N-acetyltransferase [Hyphomicrobiaceae bacterium]
MAVEQTLERGKVDNLIIKVDDLGGSDIQVLLEQHLAFCRSQSPPGSVHALDIDDLRDREGLVFWSALFGARVLGCIALQELDPSHGEIKSMHTARAARGKGVGKALVVHLLAEARTRSYQRLSLETGTMAGFAPARRLYEGFGFVPCPPFGSYFADPNSICMTMTL